MALNLAINDIVQMQYVTSDSDQASYCTVHYKVTGVGVSIATLQDFVTSFSTLVAPKIKPMLSNTAFFAGIMGQVISPLPLMARATTDGDSGAGTGGAIGQPRQVSGLIRFQTELAGPGFRGRNYLPFPPAAANQLYGAPTNAYIAFALVLSEALRNFITVTQGGRTATVQFGLFRRAGSIFTPIISTSAASDWATQKRRGTFGRPNLSPI